MQLTSDQKKELLKIARLSLEAFVLRNEVLDFKVVDKRLWQKEGAFVTLHINNNLRGCIGNIVSDKPLWQTVKDMAIAAGTDDPRFLPVATKELKSLDYEISVLSKPRLCNDWKKIELGKHGVIISKGRQGGVFLPQVATETNWSLEEFLQELCSQKAGLKRNAYKDNKEVKIEIFTAEVFS